MNGTREMLNLLKRFFWFYPRVDVQSSQTFYQTVFALNYLENDLTDVNINIKNKLLHLILDKQNVDGGFDIGFNFLFGTKKLKPYDNSSTTPETLSVLALYYLLNDNNKELIFNSFTKHLNWIQNNVVGKQKQRIAYCPSYSTIPHITNSTTFAFLTTGIFKKLGLIKHEPNFRFSLKDDLIFDSSKNSGFYYYFLQDSKLNINEKQINKVDNYHLAQQGWCHLIRFKLLGEIEDLDLSKLILEFFVLNGAENRILNYCKDKNHTPNNVPLWGAMSLVQFASEFYLITNDKRALNIIKTYTNFVLKHQKPNGQYPAVVSQDGTIIDNSQFIRGDAWICHGFAAAFFVTKDKKLLDASRAIIVNLINNDYKGNEPNRWSRRKLISLRIRDFLCLRATAHY